MPITLKSTSNKIEVYNLAHPALRTSSGEFAYRRQVVGTVDEDARTGVRRARATKKLLPTSITFRAGEERAGLPLDLLQCPEIAEALKPTNAKMPRRLKLISQTPDAPPGPKPPTEIGAGSVSSGEAAEVLARPGPDPFVTVNEVGEPRLDEEAASPRPGRRR